MKNINVLIKNDNNAQMYQIENDNDNTYLKYELYFAFLCFLTFAPTFILFNKLKLWHISPICNVLQADFYMGISFIYISFQSFCLYKIRTNSTHSALIQTLNSDEAKKLFRRFLEKEFSSENLKFWEEVQILKQVPESEIESRVLYIYNVFVKNGSYFQVFNIYY